jgi:hypothetical protein
LTDKRTISILENRFFENQLRAINATPATYRNCVRQAPDCYFTVPPRTCLSFRISLDAITKDSHVLFFTPRTFSSIFQFSQQTRAIVHASLHWPFRDIQAGARAISANLESADTSSRVSHGHASRGCLTRASHLREKRVLLIPEGHTGCSTSSVVSPRLFRIHAARTHNRKADSK